MTRSKHTVSLSHTHTPQIHMKFQYVVEQKAVGVNIILHLNITEYAEILTAIQHLTTGS